MNAIRRFIHRVRTNGKRRPGEIVTVSMGRERRFTAWDVGEDTFIFEVGVLRHLDMRPSVLTVPKADLRRGERGMVMTMTTGNHAVAAFPLLDGRFWKLSRLKPSKRGDVLMHEILCSNVVAGKIETSQRDLPAAKLFALDAWLVGPAGFALDEVVMGDRNEAALEHYRELGQDWRVKPLAWTEVGMKAALAAAKKRIDSPLGYFHSARGVHFLTLPEFRRLADLAKTQPAEFVRGLRELTTVYDGHRASMTREPKYRGHHEIELFGLARGESLKNLVPELDKLMEAIALDRITPEAVAVRAQEIASRWATLLTDPAFADEESAAFTEALYMNVTGEVYAVQCEDASRAFDDRRTALPGATFVEGRPVMHPGADTRTEVLMSNLRGLMSKDEIIEYANVYEIRDGEAEVPLGAGRTRELVYKTNRRPLEVSVIEKRLSSAKRGYGAYMLARIGALRALGIQMSGDYLLLRRRAQHDRRPIDFYIRQRCAGEPLDALPASYFRSVDDASVEDRDVVLGLATLMGDAAAQNMAMKKYDPKTRSPLFGVGKEIYDFEYDLVHERVVPKRVATCSIRGSLGWPDTEFTEENLQKLGRYYMLFYAHALKDFQAKHSVPMAEMAERFLSGFEYRTHALAWQLSVRRENFEGFAPDLRASFGFEKRWRFLLWSLERQERRLPVLRQLFLSRVEAVQNEDIRNHPVPVRLEPLSGETPGDAGGQAPRRLGGGGGEARDDA